MKRKPMWRRYLRFWGSDVRADVDAELDYHLRELTERLVHEGRGPAEARAEAEKRFGDYARVEEACVDIDRKWERQQRWRQLLADLWQDLRIGVRTLAKNPGFTFSAVVVLGLGLGAATVMVSVINAVFIRPLPFPEPERIVSVVEYGPSGSTASHTQRAVAFMRDRSGTLSVVAGIGTSPGVNLVSDRGATYVRNLEVTAGYFQVFGIEPRLGRTFSRDDETEPSTVVLSHAVWVGQFDADPGVVGEDIRLGGRPHTVIGVMPPDFWSFEEAGAWTPFRPDPRDVGRNYRLVGRLAAGRTAAQAEAELQALAVSLEAETPAVAGLPNAPPRRTAWGAPLSRPARHRERQYGLAPGCGRGGDAAHRLRQRGRAAGGSRGRAPAGVGRAGGVGWEARTVAPAASDRKRPAGHCRRFSRRAGCGGRRAGTCRDAAGVSTRTTC